MSVISSFCDILMVKVVGDPDWRQRFVVLSDSTLWIYGDDQDPRRTKIHPVRDLAVCRRICDGCPLVLHIKNIAKLDWFKIKFNTEKQLNAWKKRMRQVKEAWNEETYFEYLNQKSQLRCPYEPLTRLNRQVPSNKQSKPRLPFSRSRSLQEIISWEKLPMTLIQINKEILCGMDDIDAILIKVRMSILENEMAYNREMEKMLVAFKKRALWPDYFLMDDKSLIEQTLSKLKESSDTLLHDVEDMWPDTPMVLERLDDLADLLVKHLKSVARTRMITYIHLLRDFRPFLRNNLESVDDIYSDVYSEHFHVERALLPIFRVYKLKAVSKKLAVMLSAEKDGANSARWNKLFDLCQETLTETYGELSRLFGDYYALSVTQLFAFSDKHAAFERNGNMSLFEKFELAREVSEICDPVVPLIKVVIVEGASKRGGDASDDVAVALQAAAATASGPRRSCGAGCWDKADWREPGGPVQSSATARQPEMCKNPFNAIMDDDVDRTHHSNSNNNGSNNKTAGRQDGGKRKTSSSRRNAGKCIELEVYSRSVSYFHEQAAQDERTATTATKGSRVAAVCCSSRA